MDKSKKAVILVAEDDADDRLLMEKAFKKVMMKSDFFYVEDGFELMQYLKRGHPYQDDLKYPSPNIIILDLNMPKKDGREALREIKGNDDLCKIPVVVFTTSQSNDDILYSYKMGGNSFITKPTSLEQLSKIGTELEDYWFNTVELPD